jgi:hypothetical protein
VLHVTLHPKEKNFPSPYKPLSHQFKSRSNSSVRLDIAKHVLVNECHLTAAGIVSSRTATYRQKTRETETARPLVAPNPTKITFYLTTTTDAYFETKKMAIHKGVQFYPVSLQFINTDNG